MNKLDLTFEQVVLISGLMIFDRVVLILSLIHLISGWDHIWPSGFDSRIIIFLRSVVLSQMVCSHSEWRQCSQHHSILVNFDLTCHPTWDLIRLYEWLWFQWDDVFPATEKCRYHRVHTSPRISCRTQSSQEWRISRENTALARGNVPVCSLENRVFPSFWRQRHRRPTRTSAPKAVWTRKEKENSGLVQKKKKPY